MYSMVQHSFLLCAHHTKELLDFVNGLCKNTL